MPPVSEIEASLSPPLKWAGGKRWLVPVLNEIWRDHSSRRLVEPFVGGMAVALGLDPARALLNDSNPHLINFYRWLQQGLVVETSFENEKEVFYEYRKRFNQLVRMGESRSKEAAELFYYLNRTGFNGLCRFNSRGEFNVPFGRYKTINYTLDFRAYSNTIGRWSFTTGDFDQIETDREDFLYVDPPYDVEFTSYSAGGFTWQDQVRLAEWLATKEAPTVASNQATSRIVDLYAGLGFVVETVKAPRRISCNGDRTPAKEMLAYRGL